MGTDYIKEIENSNVYDVAKVTPISFLNKISSKYKNKIYLKERIYNQYSLLSAVAHTIRSAISQMTKNLGASLPHLQEITLKVLQCQPVN